MKPAPFDYLAPATIEEACGILTEAGGGAAVLAGGQTLMPLLNLRMSQPFVVVDINKIPELTGIDREIDPGQRDYRLFGERVDAAQVADGDDGFH